MKKPTRILLGLLFAGLSLPAAAAVNAWLDHNQVGPGEAVQLTLQHDGQTDTQPYLTPLKQDFEIAGRSSGSSIQIVNGKMNAQTQISLMLMPKHSGKLQVPALQWDGQATTPLSLTVGGDGAQAGQGNAQAGKEGHVFVSATLEQKRPYVQAAVPLTVRIYTDQPLYQASLDFQSGNDVLVQQLGQDRQTSETRDGRNYQVIERRYLLFPQRSGRVRLDGPVLNAQIQDSSGGAFGNDRLFGSVFGRNPFAGMLNSTKPIRIHGDPVALEVRPRPDSVQGHDWLPARKVTLQGRWQPDGGSVHAGDPVTLHLQLDAEGQAAAQLPDLSGLMQVPDGLRAYPDQPKLSNDARGNAIVGTRAQDIAVIANTPGRYEIPALHLFWWDTANDTQREIEVPAHTLEVLPAPGGIAISTAPPQNTPSNGSRALMAAPQATESRAANEPWKWSSLAFALLWLGTLSAWWYSRRNALKPAPPPAPSAPQLPREGEARKAFRQACRENKPDVARRHLLDWAQAIWPQDPPRGLHELGTRLGDAALKALLSQLDRACYSNGEWRGNALSDSLKELPRERKPVARGRPELSPLYP